MDSVLAAISDESRRTVLGALSRGPATVTELAALLPIARPGVSRHLRVLRILGSLREENGRGVIHVEDVYPTDIDDLWSAIACVTQLTASSSPHSSSWLLRRTSEKLRSVPDQSRRVHAWRRFELTCREKPRRAPFAPTGSSGVIE